MTRAFRPVRLSSEDIDRAILDTTAGLLARRGLRDTAVQAVADATGYSKTGLLGRFPSKEALVDSALRQCVEQTRAVHAQVAQLPDGPRRDATALRGLIDLALLRRGWTELALASVPPFRDEALRERLSEIGDLLFDMFHMGTDLERRARVTGAIGALAVLALTYDQEATPAQARPLILATCWGALGHHRPLPEADDVTPDADTG
ncbi:TetR/AcrR family transcriptional regulator [Streptomyces corynorhini]|uniref:TetR/AcrR family transcriptional regulator n=1 Tax=Streptomyces corynorhini TaxID=2282652 RepID=A0A370B8S0_9ACTN|nr:TetR/AcrR family transcriptional regulator [Streptomyces corynorhini]RDG38198.1 TetR/AcrR family transcriptional regulator [Streptomyces corynorhini]